MPGLVPDDVFFEHLAHRRFVAGRFIRKPEQLDYLQEPDVFHDVFGHVPLLSDPVFADYMQAYGLGGLKALRLNALEKLARLYWYTVEFGLIAEPGGLRLYGAGILSSFGESQFALDDPSPHRLKFDLMRVMRTRYRIDDYQQSYFVIDNFEELLHQTQDADFTPLYARLEQLPDLAPDAVIPQDRVLSRGTQNPGLSRKIPIGGGLPAAGFHGLELDQALRRRIGGKFRISGRYLVGLQDIGGDIGHGLHIEGAGIVHRHGGLNPVHQIAGGLAVKIHHQMRAGQGGNLVIAFQRRAVTAGAIVAVGCFAARRLGGGIGPVPDRMAGTLRQHNTGRAEQGGDGHNR